MIVFSFSSQRTGQSSKSPQSESEIQHICSTFLCNKSRPKCVVPFRLSCYSIHSSAILSSWLDENLATCLQHMSALITTDKYIRLQTADWHCLVEFISIFCGLFQFGTSVNRSLHTLSILHAKLLKNIFSADWLTNPDFICFITFIPRNSEVFPHR